MPGKKRQIFASFRDTKKPPHVYKENCHKEEESAQ